MLGSSYAYEPIGEQSNTQSTKRKVLKVVFGALLLLIGCAYVLEVAGNYDALAEKEFMEIHTSYSIDNAQVIKPEVERLKSVQEVKANWGFFKKIVNVVVSAVKAVVTVAVTVVNAVIGLTGFEKCTTQKFPNYPMVDAWDLAIAQSAVYNGATVQQQQADINANAIGAANFQVLDTVTVTEWRMMLVKDKRENVMWVVFRGTVTFNNWVNNIAKFFRLKTSSLQSRINTMGQTIINWEKRYGLKIRGFIGHSAGGWYSNEVLINWQVWRITLNAFDTYRSSKFNVNFRTMGDPVSAARALSNFACLTYCPGGHGNIEFQSCWKGRINAPLPSSYGERWGLIYDSFKTALPLNQGVQPAANVNAAVSATVDKPLPRAPATTWDTTNWIKVYSCHGNGGSFVDQWFTPAQDVINWAGNRGLLIQFVDPTNKNRFAKSSLLNSQWNTNLAAGKSLSYTPSGANSAASAANNVEPASIAQNFQSSCSQNSNPNFPSSIYWACGNAARGFHVIPSSKTCTWSWSDRTTTSHIEMWVLPERIYGAQGAPQAFDTAGWTRVFGCSGSGASYRDTWYRSSAQIVADARRQRHEYVFLDPLNNNIWVQSDPQSTTWNDNVAAGRGISDNANGAPNTLAWTRSNVIGSPPTVRENFAFTCGNGNHPSFGANIFWACGNAKNGFHVIPTSRLCKWSWSNNNADSMHIELWTRPVGNYHQPRPVGDTGSSSE